MGKAFTLIEQALTSGCLTEKEHDTIMHLIHRDGVIDDEEQKYLSRLFQGISSGKIKVLERDAKKSSQLDQLKSEALNRDAHKEVSKSKATFTEIATLDLNESTNEQVPLEEFVEPQIESNDSDSTLGSLFGLELHKETPHEDSNFKYASGRMLEANISNQLWIKRGAMAAYRGNLAFRREGITEHGLKKLIKRGISGEQIPLTAVEGVGKVFLADQGKKISIIELQGTGLYLQAEHVLAFEKDVGWDIQSLFNVGTALAGGLFHIRLFGAGQVAFCSRFEPIILRVSPETPLITDAQTTVGWSSGVRPSMKTDINMQTLVGRTSGETIQLRFEGDGIVIIQPYEENSEA